MTHGAAASRQSPSPLTGEGQPAVSLSNGGEGVAAQCRILPGIDIDIPTGRNQKKTEPQDVFDSTTAAFKAGAAGIIFSRKYSEMRLANLSAGGRAVKEFPG